MEVNGEIHAPTALPPGTKALLSLRQQAGYVP